MSKQSLLIIIVLSTLYTAFNTTLNKLTLLTPRVQNLNKTKDLLGTLKQNFQANQNTQHRNLPRPRPRPRRMNTLDTNNMQNNNTFRFQTNQIRNLNLQNRRIRRIQPPISFNVASLYSTRFFFDDHVSSNASLLMKHNKLKYQTGSPRDLQLNLSKRGNKYVHSRMHTLDSKKLDLKAKRNFYLSMYIRPPSISNEAYNLVSLDSDGFEALLKKESQIDTLLSAFNLGGVFPGRTIISKFSKTVEEEFQSNLGVLHLKGVSPSFEGFEDSTFVVYFKLLELVFFNLVLDFEAECLYKIGKKVCGLMIIKLVSFQQEKSMQKYREFDTIFDQLKEYLTKVKMENIWEIVEAFEIDKLCSKYREMYDDFYSKLFTNKTGKTEI